MHMRSHAYSITIRPQNRNDNLMTRKSLFLQPWAGYAIALASIAAVTALLKLLGEHINATTVALVFLLIILFVATAWGSRPAVVASLVGIVCFNFFFLPPFRTFAIRDPAQLDCFCSVHDYRYHRRPTIGTRKAAS